jgi:hypothetical protein
MDLLHYFERLLQTVNLLVLLQSKPNPHHLQSTTDRICDPYIIMNGIGYGYVYLLTLRIRCLFALVLLELAEEEGEVLATPQLVFLLLNVHVGC